MTTKNIKFCVIAFLLLFIFGACGKDEDDPNPVDDDIIMKYSGSGSEGDLITFDINHTTESYTIHNETTGNTDNGNYDVITSSDLSGIYNVNIGSNTFYAVELDDRLIAANFPTGNPENNISFGVSASIDNNGNEDNIVGDYIYIVMDNHGIMNDTAIKEWGLLNIKSDHTWLKQNYASNTGNGTVTEQQPENFVGNLPITTGDESGGWSINGANKERLNVTIDGASIVLTGYAYATANEAAFLLDLGTGNGFLIGLKITNNSSFSSIAGDYKFVNVWDNGFGAGNYSVTNTGMVSWVHNGSEGNTSGNFQLTQCANSIKNVYYCNSVDLGNNYFEKLYCVIIGDIIVHFGFDNANGDFAQYGIGARL